MPGVDLREDSRRVLRGRRGGERLRRRHGRAHQERVPCCEARRAGRERRLRRRGQSGRRGGHGRVLLLLNPDSVVHEGAVRELVEFARVNPGHGLYGGRTLWPDGTVCPGSCWGKPSLWSLFCFSTLLSTVFKGSRVFDPESLGGWQRDSVREVDIVTGCLLLAPREVWDELGRVRRALLHVRRGRRSRVTRRASRPAAGHHPGRRVHARGRCLVGDALRQGRPPADREGDLAAQALATG